MAFCINASIRIKEHRNPDFGVVLSEPGLPSFFVESEPGLPHSDVEYAKNRRKQGNNANLYRNGRTPKSGFRWITGAPKPGFRRLGNPDFGANGTPKSGFRCFGDLKEVIQKWGRFSQNIEIRISVFPRSGFRFLPGKYKPSGGVAGSGRWGSDQ